MLDLLLTIGTLLAYSCATGFCVLYGVKLLDFCMDYPNPLWQIRYRLAMRYTTDRTQLATMKATADAQADPNDKPVIMQAAYEAVVAQDPAFKRWTCIWCLATYTSLFAATGVALILLSLYGWWVILYWLTVFPWVAAFGRI